VDARGKGFRVEKSKVELLPRHDKENLNQLENMKPKSSPTKYRRSLTVLNFPLIRLHEQRQRFAPIYFISLKTEIKEKFPRFANIFRSLLAPTRKPFHDLGENRNSFVPNPPSDFCKRSPMGPRRERSKFIAS
jgi:hypothetical protein